MLTKKELIDRINDIEWEDIEIKKMVHLAEDAGSGFYKIFSNWKEAVFSKPLITSNRRDNYFRINFPFQSVSEKVSKKYQAGTKFKKYWKNVKNPNLLPR